MIVRVLGSPFGRRRGLAPVALMPGAAFAVHQLRYYLAYGSAAGAELERTGHSYLHSVVPWIVGVLSLVAGGFLLSLGRAVAGQRTVRRYGTSLVGLWLVCSVCLVAIFAMQESLEGLFATGHPGGLAGIFGFGGWWAIFASLCLGLVLAALFHGARWVLDEVAARRRRTAWITTAHEDFLRVCRGREATAPVAPLVDGWSGRGPPVAFPVAFRPALHG